MSTATTETLAKMETAVPMPKGKSLWDHALIRIKRDKMAMACLGIIIFYALLALATYAGLIASPWDTVVGAGYQPPSGESFQLSLGTDIFGRSVMYKVIHGTKMAMSVGFVVACLSVPIGVFFGSIAGYFGGWLDEAIVWFYTTLSSIPGIMLLLAIAFAMGRGEAAIYVSLISTSWIGMARVIRGEFIKHKNRDYVIAADSLGASHFSKIFKHILPNVSHFIILNFSLQFMSAIKSEVILSFLGLGVQGKPSWGIMIDDSKLELARGVWWQLTGATVAMTFIVLAFNIFGDALRDALDPKIK